MQCLSVQIVATDPLVPSLLHIRAQQVQPVVKNNGATPTPVVPLELSIPELSVEPVDANAPIRQQLRKKRSRAVLENGSNDKGAKSLKPSRTKSWL